MKKSLEEKQVFWRAHFESCKISGLSQSDYCQRQNIVESQFYYWKKQLGLTRKQEQSPNKNKNKKSGFVAAQVSLRPPVNSIIHLRNGISIEGISILDEGVLTMIKQLNDL